jgi:hypothetical protein
MAWQEILVDKERLEGLIDDLAKFASERYQARHFPGQYWILDTPPDEVLGGINNILNYMQADTDRLKGFTKIVGGSAFSHMMNIQERIKRGAWRITEKYKYNNDWLTMVREDPEWGSLRYSALEALKAMEFDLSAWEEAQANDI